MHPLISRTLYNKNQLCKEAKWANMEIPLPHGTSIPGIIKHTHALFSSLMNSALESLQKTMTSEIFRTETDVNWFCSGHES